MIKLLVYGRGETYQILKRMINWENVQLEAFIDSYAPENECKQGDIKIIPLSKIKAYEFDYILCASSDYEDEMRRVLKKLQVSGEKIVPGKLDYKNILENSFLFDISHVLTYQNYRIEKSNNLLIERNRFCDIRKGISWLDEKVSIIGDGDWAVGYDYLSVLCKVIQTIKPKNILEMGLGQSSKVIMNYQKNNTCKYKIIEQDAKWYEFFKKENGTIPEGIEIFIRPIKQVFNETYGVDVNYYSDISDIIADERYDVISIDGPWGSDGISRMDMLPYIPACLKKSWCIMIDDYERDGEKNMIWELENILQQNMVRYCKKIYGKYRQLCLLTSEDNKYLCSLF